MASFSVEENAGRQIQRLKDDTLSRYDAEMVK